MKVNLFILSTHPFIEAFIYSDLFGRLIILALIGLSVGTWALLLQKYFFIKKLNQESKIFHREFKEQKNTPAPLLQTSVQNSSAFGELYQTLNENTREVLEKNSHFAKESGFSKTYLTESDIDYVESKLYLKRQTLVQRLEHNLYILAIVVGLAPFLGLLGTVWGILTTFSELQAGGSSGSNQAVLGGLSMALATTVLGLLDAIPALIGYGFFKNAVKNYDGDLEQFSHSLLSDVELQYRVVQP